LIEMLLRDIAEYCRRARMAESTFGRLAVNDGKFVSRLRLGGRLTTDTVTRVRAFIQRAHGSGERREAANTGAVGTASAEPIRRTQFPLLRQPSEISAVRHHLQ